ncbi:odorant receptor Or2-like [Microplitis mediator]|uniref:odorant receptor Or2-like n=1 Tax=Microplitis mediator TaxID=375433 RepID=UPI0025558C2D|nr:odorant receptor Or2-like [Microplitis mediator]
MVNKDSIVRDVEWAIGSHRRLLQISGLWMYPKKCLWFNVQMNIQTILFALSIFGFVTYPQTSALLKVWGDVTLIGDNIMSNLPVTIAGIKLIKLWTKKRVLVSMINKMENDWYQVNNDTERNVMIKYAKIPKIMLVCGLLNITTSTLFYHTLSNFFGITLRAVSNNTDIYGNKILPLQSLYFFDIPTSFCFYLISWSQLFGSLVASLVYTTFDITFGLFVLHTCAQLENLAGRIQIISIDSHSKFRKYLNSIVSQHCSLISFVDQIESIFSTVLLGLVISFGILFSILGFQIIVSMTDKEVKLPIFQASFYILFMNYFLCLMFIYSWVGEALIRTSESINTAVYNSNWILLTAKDRIQIVLLLLRSQTKLNITIGSIVPVSLDSFAKLIKTSAGYISMLLAAKE